MKNCKDNRNTGCNCQCNTPKPECHPEGKDMDMKVCDLNHHVLPMLQTYTTKVLKPNICCKKNILTQEMMNCRDMKYVIKWDFDLNGKTITVPNNCILEFDGGTLSNGTIVGQNTFISDIGGLGVDVIFGENITREGTWRQNEGGGSVEQVQSDWNQTDAEAKDFIKNKPTIPAGVVVDTKLSKTSTNPVQNKVIAEALENAGGTPDKPYDPTKHSGLGRKTLELKEDGSNILTQEDFNQENTIYIVSNDFDLNGASIQMPAGSVLDFEGGSLNNGILTGSDVIADINELLGKVSISNLNIKNVKTLSVSDFIDSNYYTGTDDDVNIGNGCSKTSRFFYKVQPGDVLYIGSLLRDIEIGVYTYTDGFKERGVIGYAESINSPILVPNGVHYIFIAIYPKQFNYENIDSLRIYISCSGDKLDINDKITYDLKNTLSYKFLYASSRESMWINYATGKVFRNGNYYSYLVSKDVFRGYTHIKIQANNNYRMYWGALKSIPNGEYAEFCDDIPALNVISPHCIMDLPIPSDCEYLWFSGYYGADGADEDTTYYYVRLYTNNNDSVGSIKNSIGNSSDIGSNVKNQQLSINVCHWNLGHLSGDGETMYSTIDDSNFAEKRAAYAALLNDVSFNYFFNEYEDVFARLQSGDYGMENLIPYYLDKKLCPRRHGVWNAAYLQTPYKKIDHREFTSYYGKVRENNSALLQYDTYYTIYLFFIGGKNIYLVHTHYPLAGSVGAANHNKGFDDIIAATKNYSRVVIFGDLNIRDTSYLESKGFTVANDVSQPTYQDGTTLDWVLYRGDIAIEDFQVVDAVTPGLSDHNLVKFKVTVEPFTLRIKGESVFWPIVGNRKPIWYNGEQWINADGEQMNIRRIGTSAQRPTPDYAPFTYFDTSLIPPRPVFWNGNYWVDATGTPMYFTTVGTLDAQSDTFGTFAVVIDTGTYKTSSSIWEHLQDNTVYLRSWDIQGNPFQSGDRVRLVLSDVTPDTEFMICYKDSNNDVSAWIVDGDMYQEVHNMLDYVFTIPEGDNLDKLRIVVKSDSGYPDCTITLQKQ